MPWCSGSSSKSRFGWIASWSAASWAPVSLNLAAEWPQAAPAQGKPPGLEGPLPSPRPVHKNLEVPQATPTYIYIYIYIYHDLAQTPWVAPRFSFSLSVSLSLTRWLCDASTNKWTFKLAACCDLLRSGLQPVPALPS